MLCFFKQKTAYEMRISDWSSDVCSSDLTSDVASAGEAFVWIWLPGATEPVIAGRLAHDRDGRLTFNYGQSYLARGDAIAIYEPELPLRAGLIEAASKMQVPRDRKSTRLKSSH